MERIVLEFVCGLFLVGIMPKIIGQLRKEAVLSSGLDKNIVFGMTMITITVWAIVSQNNDILMGTIIGSSLLQMLAVNGVYKLSMPEEIRKLSFIDLFKRVKNNENGVEQKNQIKYRNSGEYLIFSVILLLFLSADYLLKGKTTQNLLSQIDGGILMFLFVTYMYLMKDKEEKGKFENVINKIKNIRENFRDSKLEKKKENVDGTFLITLCIYLFLGIVLCAGGFLLVKSISEIAISFEVSQYEIGLILMAWCVNISSILLTCDFENGSFKIFEKKSVYDKEKNLFTNLSEKENSEEIMRNVIFMITLLLGIAVLVRPIFISTFMVYDLILFCIATLLVKLAEKMSNQFAGSSMIAVYIGFIVMIIT